MPKPELITVFQRTTYGMLEPVQVRLDSHLDSVMRGDSRAPFPRGGVVTTTPAVRTEPLPCEPLPTLAMPQRKRGRGRTLMSPARRALAAELRMLPRRRGKARRAANRCIAALKLVVQAELGLYRLDERLAAVSACDRHATREAMRDERKDARVALRRAQRRLLAVRCGLVGREKLKPGPWNGVALMRISRYA